MFLFLLSCLGAEPNAHAALPDTGQVVLSEQLDFIKDASGQDTIEHILSLPRDQWLSARGQIVNLGFTDAVYWFQLALPSCKNPATRRVLEVAYPLIDDIQVWEMIPGREAVTHRMGDHLPFRERPILHSNFAFPVGCADETRLLFRVRSTSAMQFPVVLWDRDVFHEQAPLNLMPHVFYFGAVLIMAIYNIFVFVWTRKLGNLFYVLFTLSFASFIASLSGFGFRYAWPDLPILNDYGVDKSLNFAVIFGFAFAIQYMRVKEHFPRLYFYTCRYIWAIAAYTVLSFALPYQVAIKCTIACVMCSILLSLWVTLRCVWKRQREGYIYFGAWIMFLNAAVVIALSKLGFVPRNTFTENSVQWASLVEALLLSLAMADQLNVLRRNLASSHGELQSTLDSIETIVEKKTEDIRSILNTVEQGIMTVRGYELFIEADHSPYALKLLGTTTLAGYPVKKAFLDRLMLSEDAKNRVFAALQACLAEGLISFELNASQLPREVRLKSEESFRDLVVDWTPILQANGTIDRFLIVFRDVTDWKKLESIQASQSDVLNKLQQMTQADPQLLRKFLTQSEKLLEVHLSSSMHVDPASILKTIFIDIHTLKGESRSLGLSDLAEACHKLEDRMSRMRAGQEEKSQLNLQTMLLETQEVLQSYQRVYDERLKGLVDEGEVLVKIEQLDVWRRELSQLALRHPEETPKLSGLLQEFYAILFVSFEQMQNKLRRWCRRMALDLGRPEPRLEIRSDIQFLDGRMTESFDKILIHILQNAMAHGIEAPEVRRMHGKPLQGFISLHLERRDKDVCLIIRDDGRGFDSQRIQRKAVLLGLVTGSSSNLAPDRLKDLVLTSGFSSLESVHSYAGRGVGLDAVQDLVRQMGGSLDIEVFPEEVPGFVPFQILIRMPLELFPVTWNVNAAIPSVLSA